MIAKMLRWLVIAPAAAFVRFTGRTREHAARAAFNHGAITRSAYEADLKAAAELRERADALGQGMRLRCRVGFHVMHPWQLPDDLQRALRAGHWSWASLRCVHCDHAEIRTVRTVRE